MHIPSALRRKRDEIVATIAACEARIDAARVDLAALDQAARLFDPEVGRHEMTVHREFGMLRNPPEAVECEVWEPERPLAMGPLTLPVATARGANDQAAGPLKSIGVREAQFAGEVAYSVPQMDGERIPDEFFYLNWP